MSSKSEHEDEAIGDLLDFLRSQGDQADLVSQPDRDLSSPLTVDAMIEWNGVVVAVDHCLLSRPAELPSAVDHAKTELSRLLPVAVDAGLLLLVSFQPQAGERGQDWGAEYYSRFVELARTAIASGKQADFGSGVGGVKALTPPAGLEPGVEFIYVDDLTGTGVIAEQVEAGIRRTVLAKLDKQLARAKELGHRTGLLVDQQPRPGGNSVVWPAGPETVAAVIRTAVTEHEQGAGPVLNYVWMRRTRRVEDEYCDVQWLLGQP